jgi:hypothetical protein
MAAVSALPGAFTLVYDAVHQVRDGVSGVLVPTDGAQ